ncbi:MAG: potassium channel family protein [Acidiferrobacterales bacterium]|nr:potassium channel family protein [Acidiferrobacterales bacterium]
MFLSTLLINCVLTALVVYVHYESLRVISNWLDSRPRHRKIHLMVAVLGALLAHTVEVWIYGVAIYGLANVPEMGGLTGLDSGGLVDCLYFSLSNYTSLGMGDIQPQGMIRFVAGFEALTGLVLITWTASFLFLEMQRIWKTPDLTES